jgi:hypothetical protein
MTEEQRNQQELADIEAGRLCKEIMDNPQFKEAAGAIERDHYTALLSAKTDDERRNAQARVLAIREIASELRARFDRGNLTRVTREVRLTEQG